MAGWKGFSLSLPPGIDGLASTVSSAGTALKTALEALKTQVEATLALSEDKSDPETQAVNAAIQTIVDAIVSAIESILLDVGLYVLIVPLPKRGLLDYIARAPAEEEGTTELRFPATQLPEAARGTSVFEQITHPTSVYVGGNAHFVKTVTEAIYDAGDQNRPRFTARDQWTYCALVAGGNDLSSAMRLAGSIEQVFGQSAALPPTPVIVTSIPTRLTAAPRPIGARLDWNPPPASKAAPSLGNTTVITSHYAIIKAPKWPFRNSNKVSDVFSSNELTVGTKGKFDAEVVAIVEYDGIANHWIDETEIPEGESRFYTVAFRTRLVPETGDVVEFQYGDYATPLEVKRPKGTDVLPETSSKLPDWHRTPSVAAMLPAVNGLLTEVVKQVQSYGRAADTFQKRNTAYTEYLDREVARYNTQVETFQQYAAQLQTLSTAARTLGGAYVRTGSGTGAVGTFLTDLIQSMSSDTDADAPDPNDPPKYPPFTNGTEYVCGLVLLAVGPDVSGAETLFQQLFGKSDPTEEALIKAGIDSIAQAVATVDQAIVDQLANLPGGGGPGDATATQGLNADLTPRADGTDASCD